MSMELIQKSLNDHLAAVEGVKGNLETIQTTQRELADRMLHLEQKGFASGHDGVTRKSLIATLADSPELAALRERRVKSVSIPMEHSLDMVVKAVLGITPAGDGNNYWDAENQRMPGVVNDARPALRLLEALPKITCNSNTFEFVKLNGFTSAAAVQVEGAAKAEQALPTALTSVTIDTVAVILKASNQVLADAPQLAQFIQSKLLYGVAQKFEALAVAAIIAGATAYTPTATEHADEIGEAMAAMDAAGWNANMVILHPTTWHSIRSKRATGGEYVAGGWNAPAGASIWGAPVITSAAATAGQALVLDTRQVAVIDRMAPLFEAGLDADDFSKNMITLRAELRAALAIFSPTAVQKWTLN